MKSAITISQVPEAAAGPFVLRTPLPEAFATAAAIGFDAVELFLPGPDFVSVEEVKSLAEKHGLAIAAVGTGAGWLKHGLSLSDPSAEKREAALEFVLSMVSFGGQAHRPHPFRRLESTGDGLRPHPSGGCHRGVARDRIRRLSLCGNPSPSRSGIRSAPDDFLHPLSS